MSNSRVWVITLYVQDLTVTISSGLEDMLLRKYV